MIYFETAHSTKLSLMVQFSTIYKVNIKYSNTQIRFDFANFISLAFNKGYKFITLYIRDYT